MKTIITSNDLQRNDFITSLHEQMKVATKRDIHNHEAFLVKASQYMNDGLNTDECVELLIMDGLNRETANQYMKYASDNQDMNADEHKYIFAFDDVHGRIWNSHDVNLTIVAGNENDAWAKAEQLINERDDLEIESILSVEKI